MTEKRQYVRMDTVFPVELEVLQATGEKGPGSLLQAFTRDVSAGGMCLELKVFAEDIEQKLSIPHSQLGLTINSTFAKRPVEAVAKIVWIQKQEAPLPSRYLIGVVYTQIDEKARARLIRYAKRQLWIPRLTAGAGVLLITLVALFFIQSQRLISENKAIVQRFHESAEKESGISSKLFELQKREQALGRELSQSQAEIRKLNTSIAVLARSTRREAPRSGLAPSVVEGLAVENVQQKETHEKELAKGLE